MMFNINKKNSIHTKKKNFKWIVHFVFAMQKNEVKKDKEETLVQQVRRVRRVRLEVLVQQDLPGPLAAPARPGLKDYKVSLVPLVPLEIPAIREALVQQEQQAEQEAREQQVVLGQQERKEFK